jgi:hypothetical protein
MKLAVAVDMYVELVLIQMTVLLLLLLLLVVVLLLFYNIRCELKQDLPLPLTIITDN